MEKKILTISIVLCFLFCMAGKIMAQKVVQNGKVVEGFTNGQPLDNVWITPYKDGQPTLNNKDGSFKLYFTNYKIGQTVKLSVIKPGYEVVNNHIIEEGWTLTDNSKDLLIIMAPKDSINQAKKRYYHIVEAACMARYDSTMYVFDALYANHVIALPEYQYWKFEAEKELQHAYSNMDAVADALARIDEYDMDETQSAISDKMKTNDVLGAMALITDDSRESVLQAYSSFANTFPLDSLGEIEAKASIELLPDVDSIGEDIVVLQTYANLFESDFVASCSKYARICDYLGMLYKEKGWEEASRKYLQKALQMYEMLNLIDGIEVEDRINKIKELLE